MRKNIQIFGTIVIVLSTYCCVSIPIANSLVKEIIAEAKGISQYAISNTAFEGHQMINHAAYELDFAIQELDYLLGNQREMFVKDLDKSMQKALYQISILSKRISEGYNSLQSIEDDLYFDLQSIIGNIPFVDEPYILRSVKGIQQVKLKYTDYRILLIGSGFGEVSDTKKTDIKIIRINNELIPFTIYQRQRNSLTVDINNMALSKFFSDKIEVINVYIELTEMIYKNDSSKNWEVKRKIPYDFYMYLYPRECSSIVIKGEFEEFDFIENGEFSAIFTSLNNHCSEDCDESNSYPLGKNYRFAEDKEVPNFKATPPYKIGNNRLTEKNLRMEHYAGPTGWQSGHKIAVKENGRYLHCSFKVWTRPVSWEVTTQLMTYSSKGFKPYEIVRTLPFGEAVTIRLPKDPKLNVFTLTLASKKKIDGIIEENRQYYEDRFNIMKIENIGEETVAVIQLLPPLHIIID